MRCTSSESPLKEKEQNGQDGESSWMDVFTVLGFENWFSSESFSKSSSMSSISSSLKSSSSSLKSQSLNSSFWKPNVSNRSILF